MKKIQLLTDPDELRLLGNRHAYEILNMLRKKDYSSSELSKVLDIKAQHITYYLNRLEDKGLAEVVSTGKRREKFFRATAESFVVYSDIGENADLLNRSLSSAYMDTLQFSHNSEKIEKYIRMILSGVLKLREGSKVALVFSEGSIQFLLRFLIELRNLKARYRLIYNSPELSEHLWTHLSIEGVKHVYRDMEEHLEWADVHMVLTLGLHKVHNLSDLPEERVEQILPIRRNTISRFHREGLTRIQIFFPPLQDDSIHDPHLHDSLDMFWNAASLDLGDYQRMREISDHILQCGCLKIDTGRDCSLTVRLESDHHHLDAGPCSRNMLGMVYNMPSGELSVLPARASINGRIFLERSTWEDEPAGTTFVIEDNVVTSASAESGEALLKSRLEAFGVPGRTIGKVCFGLNPGITDPKLLPELRSLMCGSVNLTFGDNTDMGGDIEGIVSWQLTSHSPAITSENTRILHKNEYRIP